MLQNPANRPSPKSDPHHSKASFYSANGSAPVPSGFSYPFGSDSDSGFHCHGVRSGDSRKPPPPVHHYWIWAFQQRRSRPRSASSPRKQRPLQPRHPQGQPPLLHFSCAFSPHAGPFCAVTWVPHRHRNPCGCYWIRVYPIHSYTFGFLGIRSVQPYKKVLTILRSGRAFALLKIQDYQRLL